MRLLVVCSSLDLAMPLSATPAWWQLLKGLHAAGVDLIVTTYQGRAPGSPWWRAYPNPTRVHGEIFWRARQAVRRLAPRAQETVHSTNGAETGREQLVRRLAHAVAAPVWRRHLTRIIEKEQQVDAVLFLNVPPNHVHGVAAHVKRRHGIPVLFYDGDVPASLPSSRGFATGFRIYEGATLQEFDAVLTNSEAGSASLKELGARAVHTLHYGADPDFYPALPLAHDHDVFFYGHTAEYREPWLRAMIADASRALPAVRFAVRGRELGDLGHATLLPYVSLNVLPRYVARSRINLVITRQPHAATYGSSTMRPFELAMMGACMVSNPYCGIEQWFEPGKEMVIVHSADEAIDRYTFLLSHERERRALGEAARRRALGEHTFRHRAERLVRILGEYV
jgi:glycosyltransferase involved in cell wall biosynthesis